jgi:hypothetical protein
MKKIETTHVPYPASPPPLEDDDVRWLAAMLGAGFSAGGLGADISFEWGYRRPNGMIVWRADRAEIEDRRRTDGAGGSALLRRTVVRFLPQEIPDDTQ